MKRLIASAAILLLLCGCQNVATPANAPKTDGTPVGTLELPSLPPLGSPSASPGPSDSAEASPSPKPSAKDADWLIQVDDTQDYTQPKSGLLYHCNVYIYATKSGGTDVIGEYTGQIVLKMELDAKAAAEMFSEDDTIIDTITGAGTSIEADGAVFNVLEYSAKAYSDGMKALMPEQPLLQMTPEAAPDAMSLELIDAKFQYIESTITAHDADGGSGEGWGPGMSKAVTEPVVLQIVGATVYVSFPKYGFDRDFKGTITGTVK